MARLGVSKKKKSPRATQPSQLKKEVQRLTEQLESRDHEQIATSEVLRVIASSSSDLQSVLDVVAENAARLCDAKNSVIFRLDGDVLRSSAIYGPVPLPPSEIPLKRGWPVCQAVIERQAIHVHDVTVEFSDDPDARALQQLTGTRTMLAVPLLREGDSVGSIAIIRTEVRAFTDKQIALLKTFADQAVIAIENARLFQELKNKTGELETRNSELREALEQQTATSEILGVIASSPTDIQPVLDTIAENAARVCGSYDAVIRFVEGNILRLAAHYGPVVSGFGPEQPLIRGTIAGRAVIDRQTIHIRDLWAESETEFAVSIKHAERLGHRTYLATPLLREGAPIGVILIRRKEVRPFSEKQIALLRTFADQAVIAIENARLFQELEARNRDLTEALEQQTATSKILEVIASSPTDIQPVLDTIAQNAVRVCAAEDAQIRLVEENVLRWVAHYGPVPHVAQDLLPIDRGSPPGRAVFDRQVIHIEDMHVQGETEFPEFYARAKRAGGGVRTVLGMPLMREGVPIGTITLRRMEVRRFSNKQIALLKTFADQAVIAIENVRLFKEIQERNAELREALEHQTATSEVLGIISRSPTDVQPVLDAIVESAARVCGIDDVVLRLREGNTLIRRAHFGPLPIGRVEIGIDEPQVRWIREHGTLHIRDGREQNDFPMLGFPAPARTYLLVPLRQQRELIGTLTSRRIEVRPFTPVQIKLLETFADQAVIALENVRLFQELKESLEQQTATSEILGVIASSPTDLQPVLDVVAENAARLCNALDAQIWRVEGDRLRFAAQYGSIPTSRPEEGRPIIRGLAGGKAILDRETVHIQDAFAPNVQTEFPEMWELTHQVGVRTLLATPLLREGTAIGYIMIRRTEVQPFSEKQIALLKTFADQAVIAIENVRLFKELQERNRDLTEALEQQTATSEILRVIASSPTDLQPVLDAIAESAARLCSAKDAVIRLVEGNVLRLAAHQGPIPFVAASEIPIDRGSVTGRAVVDGQLIHITDLVTTSANEFPGAHADYERAGLRTVLAVPLLRESVAIGAIHIRRTEVRPFTDKQIGLLKTFADQAVIAIENVRLFKELQERNRDLTEALEQQTATSEILSVISGSPTELVPVFNTILANACRLCSANLAGLSRYDGEFLRGQSVYNASPEFAEVFLKTPFKPGSEGPIRKAALERRIIHVEDLVADPEFAAILLPIERARTVLAVPLLKESTLVGVVAMWRQEVQPFTDKQIALVKTFADQAVIAIENVRLFNELEERLEQQTATSEILRVIANSPTNIKPVLDAVAESAARLCKASDAQIFRLEGNILRRVAVYGDIPAGQIGDEIAVERGSLSGRAVVDRQAIHINDLEAEPEAEFPVTRAA